MNNLVCRLCGSDLVGYFAHPLASFYNGSAFVYSKCRECGSVSLLPDPSIEDFDEMYSGFVYHNLFYSSKVLDPYHRSIDFLLSIVDPRQVSVMDYGCGSGHFLIAAKEKGFDCCGFEYDKDICCKVADAIAVPIYHDLDSLTADRRSFDVVHLGDVLEHVVDPLSLISALSTFLKPGGIFMIEGPLEANFSPVRLTALCFAWLRKVLNLERFNTLPPYHLYMATERGQKKFFDRLSWLKLVYWSVYDSGWPYAQSSSFIKKLIACLAETLSGKSLFGFTSGNRFLAFLRFKE